MGLFTALNNAVSGLQINQKKIGVVSRNVANAGTVGYSKRTLIAKEGASGNVESVGVNRTLDTLLQKQMRTQASSAAYSMSQSDYMQRIDSLIGSTNTSTGITSAFSNFSSALKQLASDPASSTSKQNFLTRAQSLTTSIKDVGNNIQQMRGEVESSIETQTQQVNDLLAGIKDTTKSLTETSNPDTVQSLMEQRDNYIDKLSTYFDLRTFNTENNGISIYTTSGAPLFTEGRNLKLEFDSKSAISAQSLYNSDPTKSGVGHLYIADAMGSKIDITKNGLSQSGSLSGLLSLRDDLLVNTQNQIDEFAASLSSAFSNNTISSTSATSGTQNGFDLDISSLKSGNNITLDYTPTSTGKSQKITFIAVNDSSALPLPTNTTADPNNTTIGIDFSAGTSAAISAISTALGSPFTVNDLGGGKIQILDDGAANALNINSLAAESTSTVLTNNGTAIPLFIDGNNGNKPYTGSFDNGSQKIGFSMGIQLNADILANPDNLVVYQTTPNQTASGDPTRPNFLADRLQNWQSTSSSNINTTGAKMPFTGNLDQFLNHFVSNQGQLAQSSKTISDNKQSILQNLKDKTSETSGVNTDQELSDLVEIQASYAANARVASAVDALLKKLMEI